MVFRERFVTDYLDPLQAEERIEEIVTGFPQLCRVETLDFLSHGYEGKKVEARGRHSIKVLHITAPTGNSDKPAVLLMRSQHAREWINTMAVIETARQLVENYRPQDPDARVQSVVNILEKVEFMIIAESNPDGARLSFFDDGQRMWRKNLRAPGSVGECPGVDCNRNYPSYFGEAGSSSTPCSEIYHGPHALSEPEAASIAKFIKRQRNIIFAIDSHSYGQAIFRPSPAGGGFISSQPVSPEDETIYKHLEAHMNIAIKTVQGAQYETGSTSNHAGTTDEFMFFDQRIFGFDLECGLSFQPPPAEALLAALEVAEAARALGVCAAGDTGLPIQEFMERRASLPLDAEPAADELPLAREPWEVKDVAVDRWRRFLTVCELLADKSKQQQYEVLTNQGFDVVSRNDSERFDIVASAADLSSLLQLGYRPLVIRDLLMEKDQPDG